MLTSKQKEHLSQFEELGINIRRYTFDECVDILIHKYVETSSACEWSEYERFKKELMRVTKEITN